MKTLRRQLIAKLHIAKKDMQLDDEHYRELLAAATGGKRSSSDMTDSEIRKTLEHMKLCGWKPDTKFGKKPQVGESRQVLMNRIEAHLADTGRHWNYVHGMARHMFGAERVDWCTEDDLRKIVTALEIDARRHGRKTP